MSSEVEKGTFLNVERGSLFPTPNLGLQHLLLTIDGGGQTDSTFLYSALFPVLSLFLLQFRGQMFLIVG